MNNFSKKSLIIEIDRENYEKITFSEQAIEVKIEKVGLPDKNKAEICIYGLSLEKMEELTSLSYNSFEYKKNTLTIYAGDNANIQKIFEGDIAFACADFAKAPDIAFRIKAITAYFASLTPLAATSRKGSVSLSLLLAELALKGGFINLSSAISALSFLQTSIENPYFTGSVIDQLIQISHMQGFECIIDDNEIIALPFNLYRQGHTIFLSKENGLIHYPSFTNDGILARSIFNPHILYASLFELSSIVPRASGLWKVTKLKHLLSVNFSSNLQWETHIEAISL